MNQVLEATTSHPNASSISSLLLTRYGNSCIALIDDSALGRECFVRAAFTRQPALVIIPFSSTEEFVDHRDIFDLVVYVDHGEHGGKFSKILSAKDYLSSSRILVLSYRATGQLILRPHRSRSRLITVIQASEKSLQEILSALFCISFERKQATGSRSAHEGKISDRQQPFADSATVRFSTRERQVLDLISRGHDNKKISEVFGISVHTVKVYVHQIMKKTGSSNRVQLIFLARNPDRFDMASTAPLA